ncbi:MAG: Cof-type HAD-IIB family hydrolase [Holdemanella sp.]|nr:Cof-type HAD-IIB family hydrolase [Holdemanella sp.]
MVKVIFFDVDGTLISHTNGNVLDSTRRTLELLKEKGIKRVLATGRHKVELQDLPISNIEFDGYILLNGQICEDENGVFYDNPLKNVDKIVSIFNAKNIPIQVLEKDRFYINYVNEKVRMAQDAIHTPIPDIDSYKGDSIYQFIVFADTKEEDFIKEQFSDYNMTRWNEYAMDVVSKGASKVIGIQEYLKKEGIDLSETAAFGDGENDIEMLQYVHLGIAMGNANNSVKKKADYVTDSIDEDGLEKAVLKILNGELC